MLSGKLIHLIESHAEEITARVIRDIHQNPECARLAGVPEAESRERCREILKNLGYWLEFANEATLDREYEALGKVRYHESIPLHECMRGLCLIKERMTDFIQEQETDRNCMALYAEEELERRVGRFFDLLAIHMARGYEVAWRHATHMAA